MTSTARSGSTTRWRTSSGAAPPQTLEAFQEASTPVSIVFALDASGSMKKAAEALKAAARSFVEQVRPADSLALLLFSDKARLEHDLTTRRDWSLEAIDHYVANG